MCPWNVRFARELPDGSPFVAREALAEKDAPTLARELLGMSPAEFSAAFKRSPMKRAKLRGLKRNASVVLGNVGTPSDVSALSSALDDPEPFVRAHIAWALGKVGSPEAADAIRGSTRWRRTARCFAERRAALAAMDG